MSAPRGMAARHALQRAVVSVAAPLWVPLAVLYLRLVAGYRVAELERVRSQFQSVREETNGPLLVCANHLTLIDSFLIMWALRSPLQLLWDVDSFAWNTPERANFAAGRVAQTLTYFAKCIPIARGGRREETGEVLQRVGYLLSRGELALIFPEGGRSRTGRVDIESAAWGVGRIVGSVPRCRVLCVYMRGETQESWGAAPPRGDRLAVSMECIEPKSDHRGVRRSRDLARQITTHLVKMEQEYFDGRQ